MIGIDYLNRCKVCNRFIKASKCYCETCLDEKEQQMTHKFKVGDRVKYVNTHEERWDGDTGTITECKINGMYCVNFDKGSACLAKYPNAHTCTENTLELISIQDKVLIKPEDYHTLKKDDEVEITIKGKFSTQAIAIAFTSLKCKSNTNYAYKDDIISLYKLTPKATKLEVGEIIHMKECIGHTDSHEVLYINTQMDMVIFKNLQSNLDYRMLKDYQGNYYRKSGIPIDWEATFS